MRHRSESVSFSLLYTLCHHNHKYHYTIATIIIIIVIIMMTIIIIASLICPVCKTRQLPPQSQGANFIRFMRGIIAMSRISSCFMIQAKYRSIPIPHLCRLQAFAAFLLVPNIQMQLVLILVHLMHLESLPNFTSACMTLTKS